VVVGNKKDISDGRDITLSENFSKFKRYQTSAKTGFNVSKLFTELTAAIQSKIQKGIIKTDGTYGVKKGNSKNTKLKYIGLDDTKEESERKCC